MKHALVMRVRDEELVKQLLCLDVSCKFQEAVKKYLTYEGIEQETIAIQVSRTAVKGVSQYKKGKKAPQAAKDDSHAHKPPFGTVCSSYASQHSSKPFPAATTCHGCGRKGHGTLTVKCPAKEVQCSVCLRVGHYDSLCSRNKLIHP